MTSTTFYVFRPLHEIAARRRRIPSETRATENGADDLLCLSSSSLGRHEEKRRVPSVRRGYRMTSTTFCVFCPLHGVSTKRRGIPSTTRKTENDVDDLLCLLSSSLGLHKEKRNPVDNTKNRERRRQLPVSFVLFTGSPRGEEEFRRQHENRE